MCASFGRDARRSVARQLAGGCRRERGGEREIARDANVGLLMCRRCWVDIRWRGVTCLVRGDARVCVARGAIPRRKIEAMETEAADGAIMLVAAECQLAGSNDGVEDLWGRVCAEEGGRDEGDTVMPVVTRACAIAQRL